MSQKLPDIDQKQYIKDHLFQPNKYRIIDDYVIRDGKTHPIAFLVPGGAYYRVCSYIEGVPLARKLNEHGISAVIVYYRTKKKALYSAPIHDLARAIHEVLSDAKKYPVSSECYSVWGASAGGHLTASFGTKNMGYQKYGLSRPGMLALAYPVISMTKDLTHQMSHDLFLGADPTPEQEAFASVEQHVDEDYPPTFLWCGSDDSSVKPENTLKMAEALSSAGVPHRVEVYPGVEHGVGPGTGTAAEGWIDQAVEFWKTQGCIL